MDGNISQAPPTYQQNKESANQAYYENAGQTGQTYYQPPPQQENYVPPPNTDNQNYTPNNMGQRFVQFYSPPENRKLGLMRRCCTFVCCCIIIGLVIGLAAGLTSRNRYYYSNSGNSGGCNCRSNSDCINQYGSGTYCYGGCQCAYR